MPINIILIILGCLIGLIGGVIGTYFSIKNSTSSRGRSFVIKYAIGIWTVLIVFLVLLLFLPSPYNVMLWIPYGVLLPMIILYGNMKQEKIRKEEEEEKKSGNMPMY